MCSTVRSEFYNSFFWIPLTGFFLFHFPLVSKQMYTQKGARSGLHSTFH